MEVIREAVKKTMEENFETREEAGRRLLQLVRNIVSVEDVPDKVEVVVPHVTATLHYPLRVEIVRRYRNDVTDCWGFSLKGKEERYSVTKTLLKELGVEKIDADDVRVKEWIETAKKRKWKWLDIPEELQETVIKELEKYLNLDVNDAHGYPRLLAFYVLSIRDDSPDENWNRFVRNLPEEW